MSIPRHTAFAKPLARLLTAFLLTAAAMPACRADNYALIVGIDQYKQSQRINALEGATNDARALAKTLQDVAGFTAANIRLLVSGAEPEPTGANISDALEEVSRRVRPGDTLYVLYSGHGIDVDGKSYLVPWDADARSDASLLRTVLPTSELCAQLSRVPAKTLLMAFDMCRTDPRKGSRDLAGNNLLGPNQARDLRIVPAKDGKSGGPQDVITLFACSEGERSWEWQDKGRGFFSYYLEQGLRHDAADNNGVVRASSLVAYLKKNVYGAVETAEGEAQTPYPMLDPKDAADVVLATGVSAGTGSPPANPSSAGRYDAILQQGYQFYQAKQYPFAQARFQTALSLQPTAKAASGLGRTLKAMSNSAQAEPYFRQAVQLDTGNSGYAADLADALAARGDTAEAVPLYRAALRLDPGSVSPVLSYATLCHKTRDDDTAVRLLRRAQRINPKDPHPWDMLGAIRYDDGAYADAETAYRRAVSMDFFGGQYLGHLARCLLREGKKADAQRLISDADQNGVHVPGEILGLLGLKSHLPKIGIFGM